MKRLVMLFLLSTLSVTASAKEQFSICWSSYTGWVPWAYGAEHGIVDRWADKYGISIDVVQIDNYSGSIDQYTAGEFDGCTMTNVDALTTAAAEGVQSTALIVGGVSDGSDGIVRKGLGTLTDIVGQDVHLMESGVSHYLLARALDTIELSESDVQLVNTSDADLVDAYNSDEITWVVTWNPMLSEIEALPESNRVFDSSSIPGEIIDLLVVNRQTLQDNPDFGRALVGAWYEIMDTLSGDDQAAMQARSVMAAASGTDLADFDAQLASTYMLHTPAEAVKYTSSAGLFETMQKVAEFSFDYGLLGDDMTDPGAIGIGMPAGVYGDDDNIKLWFDSAFMQMAVNGEL